MVATQYQGRLGCRFILRPNCSASPREIRLFIVIISTVCLGVASAFAWMGMWPVLPFAGLEIALLAYALLWTSAKAKQTEVVDIAGEKVAVEKGSNETEQRWCFNRSWARVSLVRSRLRHYPSSLFIGSHGKQVALGAFLTEHERLCLARDIRSALNGEPLSSKTHYEETNWSEIQ